MATIENDILVMQENELFRFIAAGKLPFSVSTFNRVYDHPDIEYGDSTPLPISKQSYVEGFCFSPASHLIITEDSPSLIKITGIDKQGISALLEDMIETTKFQKVNPWMSLPGRMFAQWERSLKAEYDMLSKCVNRKNIPVEKVFSLIRYAYFLKDNRNMQDEEATYKAAEKLGIVSKR